MALRYTPEGTVTLADIADDEILVVYSADRPVGLDDREYVLPAGLPSAADLRPYVDALLDLASEWDQTTFVVTRPTGSKVLSDADIAPLFAYALRLYNVVLPEAYVAIIRQHNAQSDSSI